MFCPKCGSILKLKRISRRKIMSCSCGFKEEEMPINSLKIKEKLHNK